MNVWIVKPKSLREARFTKLFDGETLVEKSGVSLRSIRGYEAREQPVRLVTLECLATALGVEVRDIARLRTDDARAAEKAPAREPAHAQEATPSVLPPRTQLEALVDLELRAPAPAPLATRAGPVPVLTAERLQEIFTACALHAGARFALAGTIDTQRGIAPDEAKLLGCRAGVGARFHVVKEVAPGKPLGVTVHSKDERHTKRLQEAHGRPLVVVVKVAVVDEGAADAKEAGFGAFITAVATKRPWTFVVEDVVDESVPVAAPKAPGRAKVCR